MLPNQLHGTGHFLYPLKASSENLWFLNRFRGDKKRPLGLNGLKITFARENQQSFTKNVIFK